MYARVTTDVLVTEEDQTMEGKGVVPNFKEITEIEQELERKQTEFEGKQYGDYYLALNIQKAKRAKEELHKTNKALFRIVK